MPEKPFSHKELVELLGKLKEETPEYPAKLVDARKESFLKQVLDISAAGGSQGGGSGSDGGDDGPKGGSAGSAAKSGPGKAGKPGASAGPSASGGSSRPTGLSGSGGGSGARLSGGATFLGFSLKSVLIFGAVVVLLTAAYFFRDQIGEILADNGIARTEETAEAPIGASQADQETKTPSAVVVPNFEESSPEIVATPTVPGFGSLDNGEAPGTEGNSNPTQKPPSQAVVPTTMTPTPENPGGLSGALQFLICILRRGGEGCR